MAGPTFVTAVGRSNDEFYTSGKFTAATITFPVPSGAEVGDLLIITFFSQLTSENRVNWTGWTKLQGVGSVVNIYWHILQAGETSFQFVTTPGYSQFTSGLMAVYRGADPVLPMATNYKYAAGGTSLQLGGHVTTRDNSLVILGAHNQTYPATVYVPPAGYTQRFNATTQGGSYNLQWIATKTFPVAGDIGAADVTYSNPGYGQFGHSFAIQGPPPPTITNVAPVSGSIDGGTSAVVHGTLFTPDCTVEVGGIPATDIIPVSPTEIRFVTPPGASPGITNVTVINSYGEVTLDDCYTYTSVTDESVRVVKAGVPAGDNKAALTDQWPSVDEWFSYGGRNDLWGTTWTPAQVNANFGLAVAASIGDQAKAFVDTARVTVFYRVPGVVDPQTYVSVLHVDPDRQTHRTLVRQLPRSGYTVLTDPAIDRRVARASFFSSRIDEPGRNVEKLWTTWEQSIEVSPQGASTAGLQVWARVDDGVAFQLLDGDGAAMTVRTSGFHRFFFPATDVARGKYVQLEWRVPELTGSLAATAVAVDAGVLRAYYRPENAEESSMTLILHKFTKQEAFEERRTPYRRLAELIALRDPGRPPIEIRDAFGRTLHAVVTGVRARELTFRNDDTPSLVVFLDYDVIDYS